MVSRITDGEARDRLIIWIRRRMAEYGITIEALGEAIERDTKLLPVFRDAHGNGWNGEGDMPDWLRAAVNAGVDPDFFRVKRVVQHGEGVAVCDKARADKPDPGPFDLFV